MVLKRKKLAVSERGNVYSQPLFDMGKGPISTALRFEIKSGIKSLRHPKKSGNAERVNKLAARRGAYG